MEVLEEARENCVGILLFRNRTPVETFALCFPGAFSVSLLVLGQMFFLVSALSVFSQLRGISLFSSARSRCRPSLSFRNRRILSSSSVSVISLVSGAITAQFFHSVNVGGRSLPRVVWLPAT